jgi:hypothetical protein
VCQTKVIRTDLVDKVDVFPLARDAIRCLPRPRRRALWVHLDKVWRGGLMKAKRTMKPCFPFVRGDEWVVYGALTAAGCVTVIGLVKRKLTIFGIFNRDSAVPWDAEPDYKVMDQRFGPTEKTTVVTVARIICDAVQCLAWYVIEMCGAVVRMLQEPVMLVLYPLQKPPMGWQNELPPWQARNR